MKKVILTKGLPAAGKDFWAKDLIEKNPNMYKRINKDLLREMLDNSKHSDDAENFILKVRDQLILMSLEYGKHVLVTDTNLSPKHERRIKQLIHGKAELEIKDFTDVPLQTCIERDRKRQNPVGKKVILQMYNQFIKPKIEPIPYNENLQDAVICDLDGTLALYKDRSPYDASTCENDDVNEVVKSIIWNKHYVIFVSGREDKYREQTLNFLKKAGFGDYPLFMRETGDFRKDYIVKKEIFDNEILGKYNIKFCLDDRNQVVEMWRSIGLVCLQVNDGDF